MTPRRPVTAWPERSRFPNPRTVDGDAPLAVGEVLDPDTLLDAYVHGIFPWPQGDETWWWSPDPRAVLPTGGVHVSGSLARTLRRGTLRTTADAAFARVVGGCGERPGEQTWITPAMRAAYVRLHALGHAHSVEVWDARDRLVGGIYGVAIGAAFMGESMFHRATDASKVALVTLARHLDRCGFVLFDVQLPTPHLASMGAVTKARDDYLDLLEAAVARPDRWRPLVVAVRGGR